MNKGTDLWLCKKIRDAALHIADARGYKDEEYIELAKIHCEPVLDEGQEILDSLPPKFSRAYSLEDYEKDCEHVRRYYTKWKMEDVLLSKKSLDRARRYEKREGLEPFDEIDEKKRQDEIMRRTNKKHG